MPQIPHKKLEDPSYERRLQKPSKRLEKRKGISFRLIVGVIVVVLVMIPFFYEVVGNNAEIRERRAELERLLEEERLLNLENEQLARYAEGENFDEFIERYAREEMNYVDPRERIYNIY